jgi:acylphosphatase
MDQRIHIIIYGRVQAVGFRESAKREALKLGLTGWVKNNANRSVELVAEGDRKKLDELSEWCKNGPIGAEIEYVDLKLEEHKGYFEGFAIIG